MMLLMHLITVSKPLHLSLHNIYDVVLQTTRQMLYVRNDITYPRTYHTGKLPYLRNKRRWPLVLSARPPSLYLNKDSYLILFHANWFDSGKTFLHHCLEQQNTLSFQITKACYVRLLTDAQTTVQVYSWRMIHPFFSRCSQRRRVRAPIWCRCWWRHCHDSQEVSPSISFLTSTKFLIQERLPLYRLLFEYTVCYILNKFEAFLRSRRDPEKALLRIFGLAKLEI